MQFWQEETSGARISWWSIAPCDWQTGQLMMSWVVAIIGERVPFFSWLTEPLSPEYERTSHTKSAMQRGA
jgi:hypothetical protein